MELSHASLGRAVGLALAVGATGAQAIGQADVSAPGGFASACAAGIAGANVVAYGGDLPGFWSWPGYAGKFNCESVGFVGAQGSASASAAYSAAQVGNQSFAQASMGLVHLTGANQSPGNTQFAQGVANGGWSDRSTVSVQGLTGAAVWLFEVAIEGTMQTHRGGATFGASAYKNEVELSRSVAGFDAGGSDVFTTDRQRVKWSVASQGDAQRSIGTVVTFAVPVTLGTSFVWGVYGSVYAGQRAMTTGDTALTTAAIDFAPSMRFLGSRGVVAGGNLYTDFTLQSDSGIDWHLATPVPEPGTAAMWLAGLFAALSVVRRRQSLA